MLWKSLNCLLYLFIVWGDAKLFITIDGAPKQSQPPIIYIVQPYDPNYWFAPYYGPYIDEPMVTFQTGSNCTGGQRDVIIGLEDAQIGSVIVVSVLANEISMSTPFGFFGAFYLQYDGDDTNGTASNFPGGLLNSPGILGQMFRLLFQNLMDYLLILLHLEELLVLIWFVLLITCKYHSECY